MSTYWSIRFEHTVSLLYNLLSFNIIYSCSAYYFICCSSIFWNPENISTSLCVTLQPPDLQLYVCRKNVVKIHWCRMCHRECLSESLIHWYATVDQKLFLLVDVWTGAELPLPVLLNSGMSTVIHKLEDSLSTSSKLL